MEATAVREVSNADRSVYLFDLYNNDGDFYYEPCLVFEYAKTDSCWDNSDYVYNFLRRLNKNKKDSLKELKKFCNKNNFDFEEKREDLVNIYKTAKKLKFWKKKIKDTYGKDRTK